MCIPMELLEISGSNSPIPGMNDSQIPVGCLGGWGERTFELQIDWRKGVEGCTKATNRHDR